MSDGESKFKVGEFVIFHEEIHLVNAVSHADNRGWVYGISLTQRNNCTPGEWANGGSCFWWDESELSPITDPQEIILAKRWALNIERGRLMSRVKEIDTEDGHLRYAQETIKAVKK